MNIVHNKSRVQLIFLSCRTFLEFIYNILTNSPSPLYEHETQFTRVYVSHLILTFFLPNFVPLLPVSHRFRFRKMEPMEESDAEDIFVNKRIACVAVIGQNVCFYVSTLHIYISF